MPRVHPLTPSFNAGELSPRLAARTDFVKYPSGTETCVNLIPLAEGGLMRRAGTRYIGEVKSSSVKGRLGNFQFSTTQAYILEYGNQALRFYRHQGQITAATTDASVSNGDFASDPVSVAMGQVWQVDDDGGPGYVDETTNANNDTDADWTIFPAVEATDDSVTIGYASTFAQIRFDNANGTAGVGGTVAWEYWNGSTWTALSDVVDGTTGFTASVSDNQLVSWTIPSDWAATTINGSASLYYVRAKITGVYSTNPVYDQGFVRPVWKDVSTGGTGNQISYDATNDRLTLETNGTASTDIGWAEQAITTTDTNQEHIIKFRVIGSPSDRIEFQVGTTSTGTEILSAVTKEVGYHCVAFTPTASPFYIQFRNLGSFRDKDVQIDDVSLISNSAAEIDTPYAEADLYQITGPQSADVLYHFHGSYPTYKLERYGHTTWSLVEVAWQDGPWLELNTTSTTLTPSAATGLGIDLTLSSTTGVNSDAGWQSTDVGRLVRYKKSTSWGWAIITSITSTTVAVADVGKDFEATPTAQTTWQIGAWSETTGYPQVGAFYEQRLYAAATTDQPQTFWASQTADFENMAPDNQGDGTVADDDALNYTLSADSVNAIRWMSAGENTLAIGTTGGEWVPSSQGAVLTPSDITVRRQTTHGAAQVQPVRVDNVVLFVQRAKRKVREFSFSFDIDGYRAQDMTRLAQHISIGGIVEMAFAEEPNSLVYAARNDGQLLTMTYRRDEDVVGWARHIIGGAFGSGAAIVESVAVIPGAGGAGQTQSSEDRDEVWVIVKRTIDGATKRYIEVFERDFEDGDDQEDAYYADSIITYDSTSTTSITGLDHLEGETVKIWADGAIQADKTVSGGAITLDAAASVVQVGLGYTHTIKTLRVTDGNPSGTAVGKTKRIYGLTFVLLNSHVVKFGPDTSNLVEKEFREVSDPMDAPAPLFTGESFVELDSGYETDTRVVIQHDAPCPFFLLALAPEIQVNALK